MHIKSNNWSQNTPMPYKDELTVKNEISKLYTKICMQYFLHICIFHKLNMQAKSSIKVSCVDMFIIHFTSKTCSHCTYLLLKKKKKTRNIENQIDMYYSANPTSGSIDALFTVKHELYFKSLPCFIFSYCDHICSAR